MPCVLYHGMGKQSGMFLMNCLSFYLIKAKRYRPLSYMAADHWCLSLKNMYCYLDCIFSNLIMIGSRTYLSHYFCPAPRPFLYPVGRSITKWSKSSTYQNTKYNRIDGPTYKSDKFYIIDLVSKIHEVKMTYYKWPGMDNHLFT